MGKLFVIDGTDGSGKQTQFDRLKDRLNEEKINFMEVSFPNYDSPSSSLVKMYLSGEFGENASEISPYIASNFYAVDRYATYKTKIEKFYNDGGIVLADRYTTANMVHQAGKIKEIDERKKFISWLYNLEFEIYKIPKPDKVFFLNMPPEKSLELIKDRENKFLHTMKKDIHERDANHIIDSYNAACWVAKEYGWISINCIKDGKLRSIDAIHEEIFAEVVKSLK